MRSRLQLVMMACACALAVASCGKPPPPQMVTVTVPEPPPLPKPPPPPPCIAVPDDDASIQHAAVDGARVEYCVGSGSDRCFALSLGSGEPLAKLPGPPPAPEAVASTAHVETTDPELKVCTPSACKSLAPKIMPGTTPIHAATNDAGTFAVVLLGDDAGGKGYAEVWDVTAGKRTAVIKYARGTFRCGDTAFLGDTILITARTCGQPAARGALYNVKGKKLANVGNADFGLFGDAYQHLTGSTWAFLEENGHRIAVQDVAKGKLVKTIDTSTLWQVLDGTAGSDAMGNPGESALVTLAAGKLAVVAGSPANGSVAVVDVESGAVDITRAPLCIQ